jgi:L-arabinose isomerase
MSTSTSRELWFVTGSQGLYGDETLRQVASQSKVIAEALGHQAAVPRGHRR